MDKEQAEAKIILQFERLVKDTFGFEVIGKSVYERDGLPTIEMWICFEKDYRSKIRLGLYDTDSLMVGWAGNNSLETNSGSQHVRTQIKQIIFVADILKEEEKWRKMLEKIEMQPLIDAEIEEKLARKKAIDDKMAICLKVFEDANIVAGTEIKTNWAQVITVQRISASKVQIGKEMHSKQEVGANILGGVWQVLKKN